MMKKITTLCLLLSFLSCQSPETNPFDLVISDVDVFDGLGESLLTDVDVYLLNGKIIKIQSGDELESVQEINGEGKYLIPGLFDCHTHTTNYQADLPKFIHYGVTSVFITGGSTCTNEYYADMRAFGSQHTLPAPRVFHTSQHFTMEGRHPVKTYSSSNWVEGETVFFLTDTAQISRLVEQVASQPILGIKITIEDGPAPPFVDRIPQEFIDKTVKEAAKHDLEVYAHVSDTEEFLMAMKANVQNLVHFVGVDIDWDNEEHITAVNKLVDQESSVVTTLIIDKSFLYPLYPEWFNNSALNEVFPEQDLLKMLTPEVINKAKRIEAHTKVEYGLDSVSLESIYNPKVQDIQKLLNSGVNVVLGSDSGNDFNFYGFSMHEEMQILESGGISPVDILKMGTLNAAKMMKAEDSLGTIEVGKIADLLLLDANPLESVSNCLKINKVFKNGVIQERINK